MEGMPAAMVTQQIAERMGLPGIDEHRTRPVSRELLDQFELILVMETGHREGIANDFPEAAGRTRLLGEVVDGFPYSVEDVSGPDRGAEAVATELRGLIERGGDKILELAESLSRERPPKTKAVGK